jgi:hypothetical protein
VIFNDLSQMETIERQEKTLDKETLNKIRLGAFQTVAPRLNKPPLSARTTLLYIYNYI